VLLPPASLLSFSVNNCFFHLLGDANVIRVLTLYEVLSFSHVELDLDVDSHPNASNHHENVEMDLHFPVGRLFVGNLLTGVEQHSLFLSLSLVRVRKDLDLVDSSPDCEDKGSVSRFRAFQEGVSVESDKENF
jgi:hypothetical protein